MTRQKHLFLSFTITCLFQYTLALGEEVPVEDLSTPPSPSTTAVRPQDPATPSNEDNPKNHANRPEPSSRSTSQFFETNDNDQDQSHQNTLLEQQVNNLVAMNLPEQIEQLQQKIQTLNGRIEVQQHDIDLLKQQQHALYQDLNQKINHIYSSSSAPGTPQPKHNDNEEKSSATEPQSLENISMYRAAFQQLMQKQYNQALLGFERYVHHYPNGQLAANATYWIGELLLKKEKFKSAKAWLSHLVSQYPGSSKIPDAKLKLALLELDEGKINQARHALKAIKTDYPNSTAAQLASIQLQRLDTMN